MNAGNGCGKRAGTILYHARPRSGGASDEAEDCRVDIRPAGAVRIFRDRGIRWRSRSDSDAGCLVKGRISKGCERKLCKLPMDLTQIGCPGRYFDYNNRMAPRSEFESESKPRQGFMIGRYTTGACGNQEYKQALFNPYHIALEPTIPAAVEHF